MPELPQVETVRRFLEEVCLKPRIRKLKMVKIFYPKMIKEIDASVFAQKLTGQKFNDVNRYGKHLILGFGDYEVISHLRMQGKYLWFDKQYEKSKHDHVQFLFTDGHSLVYNDTRKFGTMYLVPQGKYLQHPSISKLGPQANNPLNFNLQYFQDASKRRSKLVKQLLLDQQFVCGIGNIYADQILFASGVHPERKSNNLKQDDILEITKWSHQILDESIRNKGTTIRSFSINHQAGSNQNSLKVYGRTGEKCEQCQTKIKKIKVGGRGTHFCPHCQK